MGLCLEVENHKFHRGFLAGATFLNYALVMSKEKDTLITENSVTDLYRPLLFINLSF